ncbi:MAG: heparinase II/III family protein [Candidatus Cryptobacteroides sp.]
MKRFFGLILLSVFPFVSCVKEDETTKEKGNPDDLHLNQDKPSADTGEGNVNLSVFDVLNLDYPGLEKVKSHYEAAKALAAELEGDEDVAEADRQKVNAEYYSAAAEILEYYRNRVDVIHPDVLINPDYTASDKNMADQATRMGGYRFYVRNCSESEGLNAGDTSDDVFYSFLDGKAINWEVVPEPVKDYQEWYSQKHRFQWMLPQAKVYAATKDETYAEEWMTIVESWWNTYYERLWETGEDGKPIEGENGRYVYKTFGSGSSGSAIPWTGLQPAERLQVLIPSFLYYMRSKSITPEFVSDLVVFLYDHMGNMLANPWYEEGSNIQLARQQSMLYAAIFLPELKGADEWLDTFSGKISDQLIGQFHDDGVHNEFDLSYHNGVVADFIGMYKVVKLNNLLSKFPDDYSAYLYNSCRFLQDMVYPNYSVEGINDTRPDNMRKSVILKNLREYNLMFPDDGDFEYMATDRKYGSPLSTDLRTYKTSGYYIFRTGWKSNDMMLIHKNCNDPKKFWHNQSDNGTISLYRNGRRFMPDAGCGSYGSGSGSGQTFLNSIRNTFTATGIHSTMNVNQKNLENRAGQCLASGTLPDNPTIEYLVTENPSYSNLTHRRSIFFVNKEFFVIVDEGYGEEPVNNVEVAFMLSDAVKGDEIVYSTKNVFPFTAHTVYSDNNNMCFKSFISGGMENVRVTNNNGYYLNNVVENEEKYNEERIRRGMYRMTVDKPAGKAARFITVITPLSTADAFDNLNVDAAFTDKTDGTFNPSGLSLRVTVNNDSYNLNYTLN